MLCTLSNHSFAILLSKLFQSLKERNKQIYSSILRHESPSRTLRRVAKTRCMKELGKGCLYILPAAAEQGLRCLHLRAQQRSEQKVLECLLKQTTRGHIQSSRDGNKESDLSKDAGSNSLFWLPITYPALPQTSYNIRLQFHWLFERHPCPMCSYPRDWHLKRFRLFHWFHPI